MSKSSSPKPVEELTYEGWCKITKNPRNLTEGRFKVLMENGLIGFYEEGSEALEKALKEKAAKEEAERKIKVAISSGNEWGNNKEGW